MRLARIQWALSALFGITSLSLLPASAFSQIIVDCSGNTPGAFTTINSAIPSLNDGAVMRITGSCTENVTITGVNNLWIGAPWGQTATLDGNLTINGVQNLFIYGMNVTNPTGDGIDISNSSNVTLDSCASSNNSNIGLSIGNSTVTVQDTAAFSNNGNYGIDASGGATDLNLNGQSGLINVNNNLGGGIELQDGVMDSVWGNVIVSNNTVAPGSFSTLGFASGFGIQLLGRARAVFYVWSPSTLLPDVISDNQGGGISIQEASEISLSGPPPTGSGPWLTNIVDGNGPVGIYVGTGSQLTLDDGVQITHHLDAAVDVYAHSQVLIAGNDQITNNATGPASTYPTRAGIRVDGNSEAYIRGGQISQNGGPGILELDNSSADISGVKLISNLGGSVVCDSSAWLVSATPVSSASVGSAKPCSAPNGLPPSARPFPAPQMPNTGEAKSKEAKYRHLISSF